MIKNFAEVFMERQLLHTPEGVRDIYNGECEDKLLIQDRLHNVLKMYGCKDIQTPSFEFFDIFNKERGSVASKNMFKFFDREGNTMVLRPDMTPSIARCAAKYFENDKGPIRLCYVGNNFINNSSYQGRLKETTQAGCEFIGDNSVAADAEVIALLIESIQSSGLKEFQVEVGHIGYVQGILKAAGLSDEGAKELRDVIRNKNIFRVGEILKSENIPDEFEDVFYKLPQLFGGIEVLEKAAKLTENETARNAVSHLLSVYELLKVYGVEQYVTFDLGMVSELDYYTGVIFKAYTYDVGEPIANGGRYDRLIGQFGKDRASIGFCVTIDLLHQAIKRQNIALPKEDGVKLIVYDNDNLINAIKLAEFFRTSGVAASLSSKAEPENYDDFEEVVFADEKVLERYGIR